MGSIFGFGKNEKNKEKKINEKVEELNKGLDSYTLTDSLKSNVEAFKSLFQDVDTIKIRHIECQGNKKFEYYIAFCDGLVDAVNINENIIRPLMRIEPAAGADLIDTVAEKIITVNQIRKTDNFKEVISSVTYGETILFVSGCKEVLIIDTKGFQLRGIAEPESEKILIGPREGFNESLMGNLGLVRRKLRTNELKMKMLSFGERSNTQVCICYIDSIVNKKILKEVYSRMEKVNMDAVLDTNYITELVKDRPFSPFRTTGYTERPDVVAAKILEGRIAIFVDGSPVVLTVPYFFIENFQSNEDYYMNYYYSSFSRILRIFGFFLTITIPGLYIALVAYHQEVMPTHLLISLASERQSAPLPAAVEAFVMLIAFDILRETGVRMPSGIGNALSIVGALVVGQAAVEAELVAAPMIIVVAATGITGLLIPRIGESIIFIRFMLLVLASLLGLLGFVLGLAIVTIHILNLESFGVPQITTLRKITYQDFKDIYIRAPWWQMLERPYLIQSNRTRMKTMKREYGEDNG